MLNLSSGFHPTQKKTFLNLRKRHPRLHREEKEGMELADRKSMNESVDDLMPNTVEDASRRRSNPQDELQRILAYTAQVRINKAAKALPSLTSHRVLRAHAWCALLTR
jgi:hypothetical protein